MKKLVLKALTDPKFRKMLEENPMEAAEMAGIKGGVTEVEDILNATYRVESQIGDIKDLLLCVDPPGSCGIC